MVMVVETHKQLTFSTNIMFLGCKKCYDIYNCWKSFLLTYLIVFHSACLIYSVFLVWLGSRSPLCAQYQSKQATRNQLNADAERCHLVVEKRTALDSLLVIY